MAPQTVFVFSGEGVHSKETDISVLKTSSSWSEVLDAIKALGCEDAEQFFERNLGNHLAPNSAVVTVAINMLNADLWRQWGQVPSVVLGHSVGEIAAAYVAGMLSVSEAITAAHSLGQAVSETQGGMVHTEVSREDLKKFPCEGMHIAAVNYVAQQGKTTEEDIVSITLCGEPACVEKYVKLDDAATKLKPEHPWHHPSSRVAKGRPSHPATNCTFISSVTGAECQQISADHWQKWSQRPVEFAKALEVASASPSITIEMGAHPVMAAAIKASFGSNLAAQVCSTKRQEPGLFVRSQRAVLPDFRSGLEKVLEGFMLDLPKRGKVRIVYSEAFANQGIASQQLVPLAKALEPFFPGVAAHDLYRFTSLQSLVEGWDASVTETFTAVSSSGTLEVLGYGVRLPGGVDSPSAFWDLLDKDDQTAAFSAIPKDAPPAAYLQPRFDEQAARMASEAAGYVGAEAAAMDPQHALALKLAQEMWKDAGEVVCQAVQACPERVGVYIGAWQAIESSDGRASAYKTVGTSLSALAPRVANAYNLQGPVTTVNTACSSALVAVDCALRDAKAGRIDFAIVGGVNLFGEDQHLFQDLRRAGMLSPTGRCHTFSQAADGYVRAEGGVLFLLQAASKFPSRAKILGSAVTQNSTRKPLSAVDPIAQERVIRLACADAGIKPSALSVVEMHGTGTPLGDPVEISALKRIMSDKSEPKCILTAAKMHFGHLESAAGGVGLLKAILMIEKKRVPAFQVDGEGLNPQVSAALAGSNLANPGRSQILQKDALIGVSSFGFAGSNSHVIVAPTSESNTRPAQEKGGQVVELKVKPSAQVGLTTTATRSVSASCSEEGSESDQPKPPVAIVSDAVLSIVGGDLSIDIDADMADLGVDSLGLAELLGRLEDSYGAGCITIDQIMDMQNVRAIANFLSKQVQVAGVDQEGIAQPKATAIQSGTVEAAKAKTKVQEGTTTDVESIVSRAVASIRGSDDLLELDVDLADLGVDSLGLAELLGRLEDEFGCGCITIDTMMDARTVRSIAGLLVGRSDRSVAISSQVVAVSPPSSSMMSREEHSKSQLASDRKADVRTSDASAHALTARTSVGVEKERAIAIVTDAVLAILGDSANVDNHVDLAEIGIDSLGFAELLGRLEDSVGRGCVTIDQIMDKRTVVDIAGLLDIGDSAPLADPATTRRAIARTPSVPKMPSISECGETASMKSWNIIQPVAMPKVEQAQPPSAFACAKSWICTTHVGSLPRPTDGNFEFERVIQQQVDAGIDIVNDGEWIRDNYIADVISRIEGLRGGDDAGKRQGCCIVHSMPIADDMKDVPLYAQRFTGGNGLITLNPKREAVSELACVSHPRYVPGEIPSLVPFVKALNKAGKSAQSGFFSVPSPGTLALFCTDTFFHDHDAYVSALGNALTEEYAQIAKSGLQLQVDCPDLAMGRHTRWSNLDDSDFLQVAQANIAALNLALRDVPFEQIRVHVCWGNYSGPHHKDIPADLVWPLLGKLKAKYLLMEGANPCHRNDVTAFEKAVKSGYFKHNQVIVPGMIDTTTARIEHPQLIAESLLRYVRAAGHPSRVLAGTDCGMATTAKSTAITSDIAWMKLKALAEGTRIAANLFIEQGAPVPCRNPIFKPTPFRVAIISTTSGLSYATQLATAFRDARAHSVEIVSEKHFETLRWAVDVPLALVGVGVEGSRQAARVQQQLMEDKVVARRPCTLASIDGDGQGLSLSQPAGTGEIVAAVCSAALSETFFDKRSLVLPRSDTVPSSVDVVVVGAGLLGMITAKRCIDAGFTVAVLEQRPLVGGIWSMYANSTSQVNSSEGGYCIKEFIGEEGGKNGDNRDHSTAHEVLKDFAKLGNSLKDHIFTSVKVVKILGAQGDYNVAFEDAGAAVAVAGVTQCSGVVLCVNDRVGLPRPLAAPGREKFRGVVADGTADSLAGVDWRGKRVVIAGMGAFAVENVRTALENGAAEVTVVGRRHGTICPKIIDYLNFVKPWDENYKHDTQTNVKQFLRWKELYTAAGCTIPECWPKQVKHEGHTISVSDVWFIGHFMKKLSTRTGEIERIERDGVVISSSGELIPCDVVVGCIGFERSNYLCEYLTGRTEVKTTNFLDKNMMYLADAEIDEGAFNSFFGSSVLEYGKFFSNVYVEGLKRGDELGQRLWGSDAVSTPIAERKWNQYISSAFKLIESDSTISGHAREQVDRRTKHFWRTLPPQSFVAVNKKEWEELHQRLNGGIPVPKEKQLPYFFEEAPDWCGDAPEEAEEAAALAEPLCDEKSTAWIRTTHVGSLPRPGDGNFELARVIQLQLEAGVDVMNDGEWGRDNYIADVINRIDGLCGGDCDKDGAGGRTLHSMPVAEDMKDVPVYAHRFTGGNGLITLNPKREALSNLACFSHPHYIVSSIPALKPFLDALRKAGRSSKDSFYSVPSPGTLALFCTDLFFHDHGAYVHALGEALAEEFSQIARHGVQLQVDCPDLAMGRHTRWADLDDNQFAKVAQANVDALNLALRDVPFEQIRVHVCWGNYAGPHHKDMPADLVWPFLGQLKAKYLLVEGANSCHRNDVAAFERAVKCGLFKDNQVIVPGMIDTTTARVEHPKLIADNLIRYVRAAGHPSRVMAGTDCGFASTAKSTAITADIAWMKLKSLKEGARMATNLFIEQGAPVPCRNPIFKATPFRVAIVAAKSDEEYASKLSIAFNDARAHAVEVLFENHFEALRWAVDVPLAIIGIGTEGARQAERVQQQLISDKAVARRPSTLATVGADGKGLSFPREVDAKQLVNAVCDAILGRTCFDKRCLVLPRCGAAPNEVDVVIIGAGLLGMVTARRCIDAGFKVAVFEQRPLVGGIWSMYANSTSQVNSSEGGYCIKEFIGESNGINGDNRDHSTAREVLQDFAKLGNSLKEHIFTCVKVVKIMGKEGDYNVAFEDSGASTTVAGVTHCRGVVLCVNDRVGLPRPLAAPGRNQFHGVVADGTADSLSGVDWSGKRVVIAGMGAFAVENVRTALENGAAEVIVVGRRHGTICPKIIDYLNFVKPWDENYKHDTQTNVKQFLRWKELYMAAGCTVPECWPKQVKHEGHTISVSDVWFVGHFLKKLSTRTGEIDRIERDGVVISCGEFIPCDVVVGCIGFERSNYLCEFLTGRTEVKTTNFLDKNMMYLADAEIDEGAFNSFFGSSVLEYGKFFSNVYVEGLKRSDELGDRLWGAATTSAPISERKWNQYIDSAFKLIDSDSAIAEHARDQVDKRTEHFWRTLPPKSFVAVNKKEWEELHHRLNGGVFVPKEKQLPYFFDEAPDWC